MTDCSCKLKSYVENEEVQGHKKYISIPIDDDEQTLVGRINIDQ